jgi:hypothetical protein
MTTRRRTESGFGTAAKLQVILATLVALPLLVFGFYEGRKAYWDSEVRRMCEQDGGVKVYERVLISEEEFKHLGGLQGVLPIPTESVSRAEYPYVTRDVRNRIREWDPEVIRGESLITRRSDNKVLGRYVYYARIGGDVPISFGHPTNFSCGDIPGFRSDVERQVFQVKGRSK